MKYVLYIAVAIVFGQVVAAQNLVPNGSFEEYSQCPTDPYQIDRTYYWFNPTIEDQNNFDPEGTPDYYHRCGFFKTGIPVNFSGIQEPQNGDAYAGLILHWELFPYREYLSVQLTESPKANNCYQFEMYISAGDSSLNISDDISAYFSDTIVQDFVGSMNPLPFTPQINNISGLYPDTSSWLLIKGDYVATGNENYLIIGNFKPDSSTSIIPSNPNGFERTAYVYLDNISFKPLISLNVENIFILTDQNTSDITIHANSGKPPYLYSLDGNSYQLDSTFAGMAQGNYIAYVSDADGCLNSISFKIVKCDTIDLDFVVTDATANTPDGTAQIIASGGHPPYQYSLNNIIFQNDSAYNSMFAGTYEAYVVDSNGCTAQGSFTVEQTVSINSSEADNAYLVYPTIFNNELIVNLPSLLSEQINVKIYDAAGNELFSQSSGNRTKLILSPDLEKGLYFVIITTEDGIFVSKVVKL